MVLTASCIHGHVHDIPVEPLQGWIFPVSLCTDNAKVPAFSFKERTSIVNGGKTSLTNNVIEHVESFYKKKDSLLRKVSTVINLFYLILDTINKIRIF